MGKSAYCSIRLPVRKKGWNTVAYAEGEALDLSSDLRQACSLVRDGLANAAASRFARALAIEAATNPPVALYVIAPVGIEGICKIGVAKSPIDRLSNLQIGNWNKLEVKALLWLDKGASVLETRCHQAGAEMGVSLRGEWLALGADEAAELMLKAARYERAQVYDSGALMRNFGAKTQALASHMKLAA